MDERGCIAAAASDDLVHWEILPPLCQPATFCEMEVPQVFRRAGLVYLLFSTNPFWYADRYRKRIHVAPWEGDHYLMADSLFGHYRMVGDGVLSRGNRYAYASKVIVDPGGELSLVSWLSRTPGGEEFAGVLSDAKRILFDAGGVPCLSLEQQRRG
jgi:hypothetical protein